MQALLRTVAVIMSVPLGLMLPIGAWAQQNGLPDPSPEIIRQEQRLEQIRRDQQPKASVRLSEELATTAQSLPFEANCQNIQTVTLEGWPSLSSSYRSALQGAALNDTPVGKCVGVQGIGVLVDRLRNELIAKGFITSRIEVPSQNLASGHLMLRAVIGRVAGVEQSASAEKLSNIAPLASDQPLNLRDIEQSLENLRRNPNVQVEFQLKPGALEDTTDVSIDYSRSRPLRASFSVDDSASNTTGKLIGQSTLSWDGPLGISDLAYISIG